MFWEGGVGRWRWGNGVGRGGEKGEREDGNWLSDWDRDEDLDE